MRYMIPRNVKKGQSFMGLEWKGWGLFALTIPFVLLVGWVIYQFMGSPVFGLIVGGTFAGLCYYLFMNDERSGTMNVHFLVEMIRWMRTEKIQYVWEDQYGEKIKTLQVRVNLKKREEK